MASQEGISQDQTVTADVNEKLGTHNLAETLSGLSECSDFAHLVQKAGLDQMLRHSGMHTLLAATNAAMQNYSASDAEDFLNRHLLRGGMEISDLRLCYTVETVSGRVLRIESTDGTFRIENAAVVRSDLPCTNGFIHIVDGVIS